MTLLDLINANVVRNGEVKQAYLRVIYVIKPYILFSFILNIGR